MSEQLIVSQSQGGSSTPGARPASGCIMVIFGASGDLTKRLLMPALYNLACDQLLPTAFAVIGMAKDEWTTAEFRERMARDLKEFSTRPQFDQQVCDSFIQRLHYTPGKFDDPQAYARLAALVEQLDGEQGAGGNLLFYMATPPVVFGMISSHLVQAGFQDRARGWQRVIVEKPFGHDLASAVALNQEILKHWREDQIYRIDHYLGKETVQNILAFRFSNGIFEPLWNKHFVDHIQFTVSESVGVEGRGNYYERSGVLRDMIQNHMFQMLAYVCMEPPSSFQPNAIRDGKARLLEAIRIMKPEEVPEYCVRGQYGPGRKPDGAPVTEYRQERDVNPQSVTETFAALKLFIDNWRWEGVPIYLRSGKSLWKRGTEIIVEFKKAPEVIFRGTAVDHLDTNRLIFHIQPDQGIELRFHTKVPGPTLQLQPVNMRFSYGEAFRAGRGTGYEVLIYNCMIGDATLFSRTDLVETAWRIAQPIMDGWEARKPADFPNYAAGSWGPQASCELIERDGRKWTEIINREVLAKVPLFQSCDPILLNVLVMLLKPLGFSAGSLIIHKGDTGQEMYLICRGEVEVLDANDQPIAKLKDGDYFGEMSLLLAQPRTASIRAVTSCDLFVLEKAGFAKALDDHPQFAKAVLETARKRYQVAVPG
jgi:glucose-6-phosphate 1-dehydrogenase